MAALALSSPATASAQAGGPGCHATPKETHRELPWAGNAGEIQLSADPTDCKVDAEGFPWITVSLQPPVSGSAGSRVLRYSVDTNFSSAKREGKIQVGEASVTVEQAGGPAPGLAFSPGRLEFKVSAGSAQAGNLTLYVGSEEPLLISAKADAAAPWIKITDISDAKTPQSRRSFIVTVSPEGKSPGVYEAAIQLDAPGASNAKQVVPVIMTVIGSR